MTLASLIYNQVGNPRTTEIQFFDQDGNPIPLTGATGNLCSTSPSDVPALTAITLGRVNNVSPATQASNAALGWCFATFEGINAAGKWSEQMQLTLNGEPLNGGVVTFTVSPNLTP